MTSFYERREAHFIKGISASGQHRPTIDARVNPTQVLSRDNHISSAPANNM